MIAFDPTGTIVALASRAGPAARGLVRLAGPAALTIALDRFEADDPPRTIDRPVAQVGRYRLDDPPLVLPVAILLWPGPRSYTGGPVAEIQTAGSPPILRHLVDRALTLGARPAGPGEFTLRAFLSGRLDLAQSEAVLGVIEARSPARLDEALRRLAGGLVGPLAELRDRLLDRLVGIEADLDFVEESDVTPTVRAALVADLADAGRDLAGLMTRFRSRDRSEGRPRVVLTGPPNAGKSRLFNRLVGRDAAIVSPLAGTTRDDLIGVADCAGLACDLIDTAGEEDTGTSIGQAAQARRAERIDQSDLTILCHPADAPGGSSLEDGPTTLAVTTKADLRSDVSGLTVSAVTGAGIEALRDAIACRLRSISVAADDGEAVGSETVDALTRAAGSLANALRIASGLGGEELIAAELRRAVDDFGLILGVVVSDDILDRIFRRFCIGK